MKNPILFLCLLLSHCVSSESAFTAADREATGLLFANKIPIQTSTPENGERYRLNGLRFNWAASSIPFFEVFISSEELTTNDTSIQNKEHILALWNSSLELTGENSLGLLDITAFRRATLGATTEEQVLLMPGNYYWSVIGFDQTGNLEYASSQSIFSIIP